MVGAMVSPSAMPRIAEARVAVTQLDVDLRFPPATLVQMSCQTLRPCERYIQHLGPNDQTMFKFTSLSKPETPDHWAPDFLKVTPPRIVYCN